MIRATAIVRRPAVKPERVADTIILDHEARHRRRLAMTAEGGLAFLLDLDRATALDDGDALKLEDGRLVQVRAAPERLIEVRTENPLRLLRVGWHLGNRHVATEITADAFYIAHDHVLLEMVRGLGAIATEVERPFRPEKGAYEGGHGHDHGAHDHGHGHAHGPSCGHDHHDHPAHGHSHDHAHG
jgi:urease accessory protein